MYYIHTFTMFAFDSSHDSINAQSSVFQFIFHRLLASTLQVTESYTTRFLRVSVLQHIHTETRKTCSSTHTYTHTPIASAHQFGPIILLVCHPQIPSNNGLVLKSTLHTSTPFFDTVFNFQPLKYHCTNLCNEILLAAIFWILLT